MAHFQHDLHLELTHNRETLSTWLSFLIAGIYLFGHAQLILGSNTTGILLHDWAHGTEKEVISIPGMYIS